MKDKIIYVTVVLALLGTIGAYVINFYNSTISSNTSDWGDFGGYIGGTLSLISVFLIYYTYRSQSEMNYRNQFESIFFNMLNRQREIYQDIKGDILFPKLRNEIENHFSVSFESNFTKVEAELLFATYFGLHISSRKDCLHYFRHLYHIIKYIHSDAIITPLDKKKYIDMIQSEMNDNQLFISLFNAIWWSSKHKKNSDYLAWLDDYSFFENLQSPSKWFDICKKYLFPKTKWKHFTPNNAIDDIDLGDVDYGKEQWFETLDRLHNGNTSQY